MSTRCNILVGDTQFYHHHDGDPEGVGADLKRFLEMVNQGYFGTYSYEKLIDVLSKQGLPIDYERGDWGYYDKEYELESPKTNLHADIEYLYIIDNVNGKFSLYCIDVYKTEDKIGLIFWILNRKGLRDRFIKPEYCMLDGSKATPVKIDFAQGTATVHTPPKGKKLYKDGTDKQIDKTISWIATCCQVMYYDVYYEKNHVVMEFGYSDGDPEYYFDVFNIGQKDGKNIIDVTEVAGKYPTQDFNHPATPKDSVTKSTGATMFGKNIREWYHGAYATDSIYQEINPNGTFQHVIDALVSDNAGDDVYLWTADDSIVRERVFLELCEMLGTDYDTIYDSWIGDSDAKKKLAGLVKKPGKKTKTTVKSKKVEKPKPVTKPLVTKMTAKVKIDTFLSNSPYNGTTCTFIFGDYDDLRKQISARYGSTLAPVDYIHVYVGGKQIATIQPINMHRHCWWPIGETSVEYDPKTGVLVSEKGTKSKPKKPAVKPTPKPETPKKTVPTPKPKTEKPKKIEKPKKPTVKPVSKSAPVVPTQTFEVRVGPAVKGQFSSKTKAEALKKKLKSEGQKAQIYVVRR